ncbi:MAG: RNA 2',3'-cyclic phosphodiesterase [Proteobacteria bacterium]|nr:RNA 2',3'-cyclic phosphodiesterase [Pseudomonadota bacterium]MBU1736975.1 RNA 2',3'-cyclic phosphodiesterase [Pseudomonadota bacterium]
MPRLFVAIDLPEPQRELIRSICDGLPDARWVPAAQIHLTLRFIGEVDGAIFREIRDTLAGIKGTPFQIRVTGLGHFPPRREPKVLWLGISPDEQVRFLRKRIESSLVRMGLNSEKRKFSPHITIARFKTPPRGLRLADYLASHSLFETPPCEINTFHLYSSHLTGKGADHRIESSYPLTL